ncbi:3-hydroxyacyl-CoA dehydrogenase NAD-binding domain-containing protein [Flammeovirgaceae bacterium SG7u.111]|nr:3-hydroxyacyl-CoA dehydrogenase NAD-binding domain-containing protein [Flammeovirgaceae bacterium SG7u.132]WPO36903.1 3-hydroxyacyl-CoA dehydrogenase NAD-binding domain-containing protein [Flammeovirgaceae bacterium SG7u.111]
MKKIAVIGAGTMGNGLAHVFAQNGFAVNLVDVSEKALEKAIGTIDKNLARQVKKELISEVDKEASLQRISTIQSIEKGVGDVVFVVEAATENKGLKLEIFKQLDAFAPKDTILASNTSSISITSIAAVTSRPEKVIGMHFMNPVPVMKLVEVISGYLTSEATLATTIELSEKLGKVPLSANDYPGFVANRILMPMINEAIHSLYTGVATVEAIDGIMKLGMAHPMGPLQLADFIGLDVCLSIMNVLHEGLGESKYAPCPLLVNMVNAGCLGAKSGEGFYVWEKGSKELTVSKQFV